MQKAKVLVIGAGALGNEVLKNLALLGVGQVVVADLDTVELSNLSRSVLYRAADEGRPKAECAAEAMRSIYPDMRVLPFVGNVLADLGLGCFHWADAVMGALDNREARVFVNSACARVGRPWWDGGIEVLQGIVRGFSAAQTACYECTMSQVDWDLLNKRRSCSLLARRALAQRGVPTTPTSASIIGAMQAQEVVKYLHGLDSLLGKGFVYEGSMHSSFSVNYPLNPECPWHEVQPEIEVLKAHDSDTPLEVLADLGRARLGGLDALDFSREVVERLECAACRHAVDVWLPPERVREEQALCPLCGNEAAPRLVHSLSSSSPLLTRTPRQLGLPVWDVLWARFGECSVGFSLGGDLPALFQEL